jgi:alpha-glucosidase
MCNCSCCRRRLVRLLDGRGGAIRGGFGGEVGDDPSAACRVAGVCARGTVLPMQAVTSSTMETPAGPLTLRVYTGKDCKGILYLDDGHGFGYVRGESTRISHTCEQTGRVIALHIAEHEGTYPVWWKQVRAVFYGVAAVPRAVRVNGESRPFTKDDFDAAQHHIAVVVNDTGQAQEIEIETGRPAAE